MLLICDAKIKQLQHWVATVETRKSQGYNEPRNRSSEDLIVGREENGKLNYRKDNRLPIWTTETAFLNFIALSLDHFLIPHREKRS